MDSRNKSYFGKSGRFGTKKNLFWIKCDIKGLPLDYCSVLKAWSLVRTVRTMSTASLHCLFEEPLIKYARLDVTGQIMPAVTKPLITAKMITL